MDWGTQLAEVNYWAILGAVAAGFVLGFVWYSWGVFGKTWAKHVGLKRADLEKSDGMGQIFFLTAVGSFVAAAVMAALMMATATKGVVDGAIFGLLLGFALRFTSHVMHDGFARRHNELTLIDGAHDIVQLMVMGAILGAFM